MAFVSDPASKGQNEVPARAVSDEDDLALLSLRLIRLENMVINCCRVLDDGRERRVLQKSIFD